MRKSVLILVATMVTAATASAQQAPTSAPASIDPPREQKLFLALHGDGVQTYTCALDNGAPTWRFQGPDAKLSTDGGAPAGSHYAGPTWKLLDGSEVKGSMVASKPATAPGAVAWLLIKVVSHGGDGKLSTADYITRTNTKGGVAPATGCDVAHQGQAAQVPYSATYSFYGK
jgi:Protein of unknown function (DUF3455)